MFPFWKIPGSFQFYAMNQRNAMRPASVKACHQVLLSMDIDPDIVEDMAESADRLLAAMYVGIVSYGRFSFASQILSWV